MNVLPSEDNGMFDEASPAKMYPVCPFARVVPNGIYTIEKDGKRRFILKATVMLTPEPLEDDIDATGSAFSLSHWPQDVLKTILDGSDIRPALTIPLMLQPAPRDPLSAPGKFHPVNARVVWADDRAKKIQKRKTEFRELWERTFLQRDLTWSDLHGALKFSMGGKGYAAGDELKSDQDGKGTEHRDLDNLPGEQEVEANGQIRIATSHNQERTVSGIYTQGHADMALALEYGRVNRIAQHLKNGRGERTPDPELVKDGGDRARAFASKKDKENELAKAHIMRRKTQFERLQNNHATGRAAYRAELKEQETGLAGHCKKIEDEDSKRPPPASVILEADTCQECLKTGKDAHGYLTPSMKRKEQSQSELRDDQQKRAAQIYFAVQSTGALSRLYCLAFDVEYELTDKDLMELSSWTRDDEALFLCVSARDENGLTLGSKTNCRPPWSVTKLTYKDTAVGGSSGDFWPVTREEVRAVRDGMSDNLSRFTSQLDGYRVTGECWQKTDKHHSPRFDLTSLDVRSTTEQELSGEANERPASAGEVVTTAFHTAGLAVLDRGMQAEKAKKLARKNCCDFSSDKQLLYADDLTIGFRMDVGVPEGDKTRWRPLHLRKVDYGTSGPMGYVADRLLPLLAGSYRDPARLAFDAAMVAMPEQLVPKKIPGHVDLAVAENTITWEGAPLGVETLQPLLEYERGSKNAKKISRPLDGLPFGRNISLPSEANDSVPRPPRLRFGWPYRFAMRAVYSGGTSVSPGSVDWINDSYDGRLTFPGISTNGGEDYKSAFFRFLRQKPIDPPVLLQPLAEALNKNDRPAARGKAKAVMGYQEAARVIVRSVKNEQPGRGRAQPTIAYRTILPPAMAMDDVARHGALDDQFDEAIPAGAFSGTKWDKIRNNSGFPVLQIDSVQGFNGTWLPKKTRTKADLKTPQIARDIALKASINKNPRRKTSFTSPVFCKHLGSDRGRQQYYPDPFAQKLILNLRHSGTNLPFGEAIEIPVYKGASAKSTRPKPADALPVVLKFIASAAKQRTARADKKAADLWKKRYIKLTADGLPRSRATEAHAEAIEVSIFVPAGLKLDIDCFFLPDPNTLASKSALVQALAVSTGLRGQAAPGANPKIAVDEVTGGFRKLLGERFAKDLQNKIAEQKEARQDRKFLLSSPGGLPVPDETALKSVAEVLTERMVRLPVPDVSGVTHLTCEHASDAISNIEERIKLTSPIFHRVEKDDFPGELKQWFKNSAKKGDDTLTESLVVENETDALLQGMLEIDLLRISGFDLVAEMENPGNGVFDDKTRKRDLASVRAGTWPVIRDVEGDAYIKNSRQIFGFDLQPNGKVGLPMAEVVLFKVRDLPPQLIGEFERSENGHTLIELLHLAHRLQPLAKYKKHEDDRYGDAKVEAVHSFSDCIGRNVRLKITPVLRSLPSLRTADQLIVGEHILGKPFAVNQQAYALHQSVYLPSSVRPAEPAVRGPLQCFSWLTSSSVKPKDDGSKLSVVPPPLVDQMDLLPLHHWAKRQPVVRLNLDRSWFSSDANEKVALVFWPPDPECQPWLQVNKPKLLNKIRYRRNPTEEGCEAGNEDLLRDIVLDDFQDEDLGPGGRFTTRLGADPLKVETPDPRIFLHYSDFLPVETGSPFDDAAKTADAISKPKLVQNALMPVSAVEDPEGEQIADSKGRSISRFMSVSLLVYEPLFDPESETWYIDVNLNKTVRHVEPFIRFGLVRYNDNPSVAKNLRISPPSAVWAKHLPERTVQTKYDPSAQVLFVQVDGQALGTGLQGRGNDNSQQDMPRLTAKVIREKYQGLPRETRSQAAEPQATEVTIRQTVSLTRVPLKVEPKRTGSPRTVKGDRSDDGWIDLSLAPVGPPHACWVGAVELNLQSNLEASERLVLLVEEVELYRPATYPIEPVDPAIFLEKKTNGANTGDYLVETGPRFSCRIEFFDTASPDSGEAK